MTKKWEGKKRAKEFFQKHTNSAKKNVEKQSSQISEKKIFHSQEYRDQKIVGKKFAKQFFQKHTNGSSKYVGKKIAAKNCKKGFFTFTRIP